jgi:hypothetical protein
MKNERSYDMQEIVKINVNKATLQKLTLIGKTSKELIL